MHLSAFVVAVVLAAGLVPSASVAGEQDHERARQALERGEVLPLRTILDKIARDYPGEVVEVELERERGTWIYEIELIGADGRLVKLEIDAGSAAVLRVKGRGSRQEGR